jgi:hypothetical protein
MPPRVQCRTRHWLLSRLRSRRIYSPNPSRSGGLRPRGPPFAFARGAPRSPLRSGGRARGAPSPSCDHQPRAQEFSLRPATGSCQVRNISAARLVYVPARPIVRRLRSTVCRASSGAGIVGLRERREPALARATARSRRSSRLRGRPRTKADGGPRAKPPDPGRYVARNENFLNRGVFQ